MKKIMAIAMAGSLLLLIPITATAENLSTKVSYKIPESSYSLLIPKEVVISPQTDYVDIDGNHLDSGGGGGAQVIPVFYNNEFENEITVRVNENAFTDDGSQIKLIDATNTSRTLGTELVVRGLNTSASANTFTKVTRNDNTIAVFRGKFGDSNETVHGGYLKFAVPKTDSNTVAATYSCNLTFTVSTETISSSD